eukprot:3609498-Prorocentrum_lima.AAC.1
MRRPGTNGAPACRTASPRLVRARLVVVEVPRRNLNRSDMLILVFVLPAATKQSMKPLQQS